MMAISEAKVTLNVAVDGAYSGYTVFVVGDCPELGQWKPKLAKCLQMVGQSVGLHTWSCSFIIKSASVINYRIFTGSIKHSAVDEMVAVHMWENMPTPRSLTLVKGGVQDVDLKFGHLNDKIFLDRGWLTGQVAVHLSLYDSPLKWNIPVNADERYFIKCLPIDKRVNNNRFATNDAYSSGQASNSVLETKVLVTDLSRDGAVPYLMPPGGVLYDPNAFLTFRVETCCAKHLAFRLEVGVENDEKNLSLSKQSYQELGAAYVERVDHIRCKDSFFASIVSKDHMIIGQLKVDVLVITPLGFGCDMPPCVSNFEKSNETHPWFIGHRGMGRTLVAGAHNASIAENTVSSLNRAIAHGADFVEFDVMLSRDRIPVIHHDFVTSISAKDNLGGEDLKVTIPVQYLNLKELENLQTAATIMRTSEQGVVGTVDPDNQPFPLLRSCLEKVDARAGFNVEIKYCMRLRTGELEEGLMHFPGRNDYVDDILFELLHHSGSRRIFLSSFDPDVCSMLRAKQNRYPVLFLTQGETEKYPLYEDMRTWTVETAFQFAVAESLRGVCVHAESLLKDPSLIEKGKSKGLWVICWGDDNNSRENIQVLTERGVDGIIVDKIDEFLDS